MGAPLRAREGQPAAAPMRHRRRHHVRAPHPTPPPGADPADPAERTMIQITVLGRAQPAGSKRAFAIRRKSGKLGVSVVDDAERSRPWKDSVTAAAHEVLNGAEPLDGPLELHVDFYVARPAGHYGTGKNRSLVKASAPRFPATRPDASKLCRCIEDALTDAG